MHPDQQISSRRSFRRRLRVPSSLSPVSREYPATSAARMAASSRDRPWPVSRRWPSTLPENQQFASVTFLRPPRGVAFRAEHWTGSTSRRQKKRCFDIVDKRGLAPGYPRVGTHGSSTGREMSTRLQFNCKITGPYSRPRQRVAARGRTFAEAGCSSP